MAKGLDKWMILSERTTIPFDLRFSRSVLDKQNFRQHGEMAKIFEPLNEVYELHLGLEYLFVKYFQRLNLISII